MLSLLRKFSLDPNILTSCVTNNANFPLIHTIFVLFFSGIKLYFAGSLNAFVGLKNFHQNRNNSIIIIQRHTSHFVRAIETINLIAKRSARFSASQTTVCCKLWLEQKKERRFGENFNMKIFI